MALSFKEKRGHQKTVKDSINSLASDGLGFVEKRGVQKVMAVAMTALKVKLDAVVTRFD